MFPEGEREWLHAFDFLNAKGPQKRYDAAVIPLLIAASIVAADSPVGWHNHEGSLLKYKVNIRWGAEPETIPNNGHFGRVSAVATDSKGEVYVYHRGKHAEPLSVFDANGKYLRGWGRAWSVNAHGVRIDKDDNVWLVDNGDHTVRKFTRMGELLMLLGTPGKSGATKNTFFRPTDVAFAADGSFYVSDGYGNSRVVKFSPKGEYLLEWGKRGKAPGDFHLPHVVQVDSKARVWVSDRENNRIQVFDANGKFLNQWTHLGATQGLHIRRNAAGQEEMWIVTHRNNIENLTYDTLSGRIMKLDMETGKVLGSIESPGHWIHVTPKDEIFIGSLTGNVFRFYPGWLAGGLGVDEGQTKK